MNTKLSLDIMKSIRNILKNVKPLKQTQPPRFSLETRTKRIKYVENKGKNGGEYPW